MIELGHHDYLGQHDLAHDQNQDLDFDEYGHHDHYDHNQNADHDEYGHVLHYVVHYVIH